MEQSKRLPTLRQIENSYCRKILIRCNGDVTMAAGLLGIGRASLYRRLPELKVESSGSRITVEQKKRREFLESLKLSRRDD